MTSIGTVSLTAIWKMLDQCARGWKKKERPHNWAVLFDGRTFPNLPRGRHGARHNPPIQIGHVRQMVRFFGIEPCAREQIPALR
jgi:hypothetical protein